MTKRADTDCGRDKRVFYLTAPGEELSLNDRYLTNPHSKEEQKLIYTVVTHLNTPSKPCSDSATAQRCARKCRKTFLRKKVGCSLPYMDELAELTYCNTSESASRAEKAYTRVRLTIDPINDPVCKCVPACERTVMTNMAALQVMEIGVSIMVIYFYNNLFEHVTEIADYSLSLLLAELGSHLSFFLGLSILSAFDMAQVLVENGGKLAESAARNLKAKMKNYNLGTG